MAILALQSASSGLRAMSTNLDIIANNLANVNTPGFKSSRANFQDLLYVERMTPGVENANGDQRPTGLYIGLGTKISGTQLSFEEGAAIPTGRPLDVRIQGAGFFQVQVEQARSADQIAFTRAGNFALNSDGEIVLANDQGRRVVPTIQIPDDHIPPISIESDGRVLVQTPGATEPQEVGQIELASFINPAGLKQIGENLYVETVASGAPIEGEPGEDSFGSLIAGSLEASNVDPTRELIDLIRTQRAFEMNSQSIRAADESLQSVAQLGR